MIGSKKFYFIPDVNKYKDAGVDLIIKNEYVLAEEFDNKDCTLKTRFLNGDAVQSWAVHDTADEVEAEFEKFKEYCKVYWECFEEIQPIQKKLQDTYDEMYGEFMCPELGHVIAVMSNPDQAIAAAEAAKKEGE